MTRSKTIGIGLMLVFLVIAVTLLPMIVRYVDRMEPHFVAGFQNMNEEEKQQSHQQMVTEQMENAVSAVPSTASGAQLPSWRPDPNTDYMCRSPNNGGQPCPEGTFCDGSSQTCVPVYVGGPVPDHGYYA